MYVQHKWWYLQLSAIQRWIAKQDRESMRAEESFELRRMLEETIRRVDNLGRKA